MKTTATHDRPASYLGVDVTDRYARARRPIDVCGLWPRPGGTLEAGFWQWQWPPSEFPLEVREIAAEAGSARSTMLDAPQALATVGRRQRASENACRTPGKTPDHLPGTDRPYGGFVRSSVELFEALHHAGLHVSPEWFVGGVCECYPGDAWPRLIGRKQPRKNTPEGRQLRRRALESLGVAGLPSLPSHDQNDACLGAVLAAAADEQVPGLQVVRVGESLTFASDGSLREGPLAAPRPDRELTSRLADAIASAECSSSPLQ